MSRLVENFDSVSKSVGTRVGLRVLSSNLTVFVEESRAICPK